MSTATQTAVIEACVIVGSQSALAAALGVTPSMVSQWIKGERPVTPKICASIERVTKGAVIVERLVAGPWARIRDRRWPHPKGRPVLDIAGTAPAVEPAGQGAEA
ncbi:helix-turn-helix protein [compost metagenome]